MKTTLYIVLGLAFSGWFGFQAEAREVAVGTCTGMLGDLQVVHEYVDLDPSSRHQYRITEKLVRNGSVLATQIIQVHPVSVFGVRDQNRKTVQIHAQFKTLLGKEPKIEFIKAVADFENAKGTVLGAEKDLSGAATIDMQMNCASASGAGWLAAPMPIDQKKSVAVGACGWSGSLSARVAGCNTRKVTSGGAEWQLVYRSGAEADAVEVWLDVAERRIWGDAFQNPWGGFWASRRTFDEAYGLCEDAGAAHNGKMTELRWSMPERSDYDTAESRGIREIIPGLMDGFYWVDESQSGSAKTVYWGSTGEFRSADREDFAGVRCTAQY